MSINYLVAGETIASKVVKLNKEKIKYKKIKPSQLELSLVKWPFNERRFTIDLHLKEFRDGIVTLATFNSSLKAINHYNKILNRLKTNRYELYIYSNGKIELKY